MNGTMYNYIFVAKRLHVIHLKFLARNVNIFIFVEGRQECLSETMYPAVLNTFLHVTDVAEINRYLDAKYDNDMFCFPSTILGDTLLFASLLHI